MEIYNFSDDDVQFQNWQIRDNLPTDDLYTDGFTLIPSLSFPEDILFVYVDDLNIGNARSNSSMAPNPFSPDGDGCEDEMVILYQLPFASSWLRMLVFDAAGREVAVLADGHAVTNEGVIRWQGKTDRGSNCRMGQYLLMTEAASRQTG